MKKAPMFHVLTKLFLLVSSCAVLALGTACGSDSPGGGAGGNSGGNGDTAKYNFETDAQGWISPGPLLVTDVMTSTAQKFKGNSSLVGTIAATAASTDPYVLELVFMGTLPTITPGGIATFNVYIPAGSAVMASQPYINEGDLAPSPYRFTGKWLAAMPGTWQTIEVQAPADVTPILKVGVQFFVGGAWTGQVYVDSVNW